MPFSILQKWTFPIHGRPQSPMDFFGGLSNKPSSYIQLRYHGLKTSIFVAVTVTSRSSDTRQRICRWAQLQWSGAKVKKVGERHEKCPSRISRNRNTYLYTYIVYTHICIWNRSFQSFELCPVQVGVPAIGSGTTISTAATVSIAESSPTASNESCTSRCQGSQKSETVDGCEILHLDG